MWANKTQVVGLTERLQTAAAAIVAINVSRHNTIYHEYINYIDFIYLAGRRHLYVFHVLYLWLRTLQKYQHRIYSPHSSETLKFNRRYFKNGGLYCKYVIILSLIYDDSGTAQSFIIISTFSFSISTQFYLGYLLI